MKAYSELMEVMQPRRVVRLAPPQVAAKPSKPKLDDFTVERWEEPCAVYVQRDFFNQLHCELRCLMGSDRIIICGVPVYPVDEEHHQKIKVYFENDNE